MNPRLHLLNLWLRLTVKSTLNRMKHPHEMRDQLERDANRYFPMPDGANVVADTIRYDGAADQSQELDVIWASRGRPDRRKVILYLHGGAYIAGSPSTHKHLAARLGGVAGARVLVPDYRLAPDHPFPTGLNDAIGAYRHLLNAGYDPQSIALAGDSAGGGLVFAMTFRMIADRLPLPACLVGFSPWADLAGTGQSLLTNAHREVMLPAKRLSEVVDFYLNGADQRSPYASPLYGDWRDPPPSLIMAGRNEILLDDATRLADALRSGGGNVQLELWHNVPHAWPIFTGLLSEADRAVENAGQFIARHLSKAEGEAA